MCDDTEHSARHPTEHKMWHDKIAASLTLEAHPSHNLLRRDGAIVVCVECGIMGHRIEATEPCNAQVK